MIILLRFCLQKGFQRILINLILVIFLEAKRPLNQAIIEYQLETPAQ